MDDLTVEIALQTADKRLEELGAGPIMELLFSKQTVPVDGYIASHVAVVYNDKNNYDDYKSANYREDIFLFDNPRTNETKYFKIRCLLDSWDTGHWDALNITEVKPVEKTTIVWEDV